MSVISIRVDDDIKASAQEVAASMGLSLSTLVNALLRQVTYTRRVELYAPEPMTAQMEAIIEEVEADIKAGRVSKPFTTAEDFLAALKS